MEHYILIGVVILFIVVLQMIVFVTSYKKMKEFKTIFLLKKEPEITYDNDNRGIIDFKNNDNSICKNIQSSINEYLKKNDIGSIRFDILKDTIDRNCESAEEDINTLNPLPLYLGLVGTMAGIIVGIGYLWLSGGLNALMSSEAEISSASSGITALLSGVALAMIASGVGIVFTIINLWKFKGCKVKVEKGRNDILVWLQANLIPVIAISNDPALAMSNVVGQLEHFNNRFVKNMGHLNTTLKEINESYRIIKDLDVVNITEANAKVFSKLKKCTDNLEEFVDFFKTINTLRDKWEQELNSSKAMENIAEFFKKELTDIEQRKAAINTAVIKVDSSLENAFTKLNETYDKLIEELNKRGLEMSVAFTNSLKNIPTIHKELEKISELPQQLKGLASELKKSNENVIKSFSETISSLKKVVQKNTEIISALSNNTGDDNTGKSSGKSQWMRVVEIIGILIIILLLLVNTLKQNRTNEDNDLSQSESVQTPTNNILETSTNKIEETPSEEVNIRQ